MADSVKDKVENVGHKIAETMKEVGHKISACTEKTFDMAKEKMGMSCSTSHIKEHMDVIASCGCKVGVVDHVQGSSIKLTKNDSPDGQHHLIPSAWVDHVDNHVHLNKNSAETKREWQPA